MLVSDSDFTQNMLPLDGEVYYIRNFISESKQLYFLKALTENISWQHDELLMFGKTITTKRKVAWYADSGIHYTYSKKTKVGLPWIKELVEIKLLIEKELNQKFNSCLLNLYHDGDEGMGWHSDDEKELGVNPFIASLSFGDTRKFIFKHKTTKQLVSIFLESGSLLVMKNQTQHYWQHSIPKSKRSVFPRINLTFRWIIP